MNELYGGRRATLQSMRGGFDKGYNCAEMVFTKLGRYYDPDFDADLMRLATGFGGGMGEAADVCGALVGGVMLIGYLYGRTSLAEDKEDCQRYTRRFHDEFLRRCGGTSCAHFTQGEFTPANQQKCANVVTQAAEILLDMLPEPERRST